MVSVSRPSMVYLQRKYFDWRETKFENHPVNSATTADVIDGFQR